MYVHIHKSQKLDLHVWAYVCKYPERPEDKFYTAKSQLCVQPHICVYASVCRHSDTRMCKKWKKGAFAPTFGLLTVTSTSS